MNNEEAIAILKRATLFEPKLENKDYPEAFELAIKALEETRPKGEWLPKGRWRIDPQCIEYTCSICGRRIMIEERLNVIEQYPFCHCGADMRGDV